jgi:hypothetical protein
MEHRVYCGFLGKVFIFAGKPSEAHHCLAITEHRPNQSNLAKTAIWSAEAPLEAALTARK